MRLETIRARGEHLILWRPAWRDPRRGWEVLYRTRDEHRAQVIRPAIERAYQRGIEEARRGWPLSSPSRSPIFYVAWAGDAPSVVECHPRFEWGDTILYSASSYEDANIALPSFRRAATLGALSVSV